MIINLGPLEWIPSIEKCATQFTTAFQHAFARLITLAGAGWVG